MLIEFDDMLSTPAPIHMSIILDLIFEAIITHASNPLEQCLLMVAIGGFKQPNDLVLAFLAVVMPAPFSKTLPTIISSINFGFIPVFEVANLGQLTINFQI